MNEGFAVGNYQVRWRPQGLATGAYFYRLQAGNYTESKKLMFLK